MIRYKQLYKHDPENNIWGDCGRTCIACLLEIEPIYVPHFFDNNNENGNEDMRNWLLARGYNILQIALNVQDLEIALEWANRTIKQDYYILLGTSHNKVNHVVICKEDKIVHDPSIDNSGIIGPADDGHFWIDLIYKRI